MFLINGATIVAGVWLFRAPLQGNIRMSATLATEAPNSEVVSDMIEQAADRRAALLAVWNSGKTVHREVAIRSLRRVVPNDQSLPPKFESFPLTGALDPDLNVHEEALGILSERNHPALTALAAEQLNDPDEQVRLLGLNHHKHDAPSVGVPFAAAKKAKTQGAQHQREFPPVKQEVSAVAYTARKPVPVAKFELRTLEGKTSGSRSFAARWCS